LRARSIKNTRGLEVKNSNWTTNPHDHKEHSGLDRQNFKKTMNYIQDQERLASDYLAKKTGVRYSR